MNANQFMQWFDVSVNSVWEGQFILKEDAPGKVRLYLEEVPLDLMVTKEELALATWHFKNKGTNDPLLVFPCMREELEEFFKAYDLNHRLDFLEKMNRSHQVYEVVDWSGNQFVSIFHAALAIQIALTGDKPALLGGEELERIMDDLEDASLKRELVFYDPETRASLEDGGFYDDGWLVDFDSLSGWCVRKYPSLEKLELIERQTPIEPEQACQSREPLFDLDAMKGTKAIQGSKNKELTIRLMHALWERSQNGDIGSFQIPDLRFGDKDLNRVGYTLENMYAEVNTAGWLERTFHDYCKEAHKAIIAADKELQMQAPRETDSKTTTLSSFAAVR